MTDEELAHNFRLHGLCASQVSLTCSSEYRTVILKLI